MSEDSKREEHERLVRLIRRIAREVAFEVLDEHLSDYEHGREPVEEVDMQ